MQKKKPKLMVSSTTTQVTSGIATRSRTTVAGLTLAVGVVLAGLAALALIQQSDSPVRCQAVRSGLVPPPPDQSAAATIRQLSAEVSTARVDVANHRLINLAARSTLKSSAERRKERLLHLMASDPPAARQLIMPGAVQRRLAEVSTDCAEREATIVGQLNILHGEEASKEDPFYTLQIKTPSQTYTVYGLNDTTQHLEPGSTIQVSGYSLDDAFLAKLDTSAVGGGASVSTVATAPLIPAGPSTRKVLLLAGDFTNTDVRSPDLAGIQAAGAAVNAYYQENSFQKFQWQMDVHDWYEVPMARDNTCPVVSFTQALIAVADPDIDYNQYRHETLAVMVPFKKMWTETTDPSCRWDGMAYLFPLTFTTHEGSIEMNVVFVKVPQASQSDIEYVWNHELGHTLVGSGHANWTACPDDVTFFQSGCTNNEYGDPYDVMGGDYPVAPIPHHQGHFNAARKENAGWLDPDQVVTINNHDPGQTVTLTPLERADSGVKLIRIQRGANDWLTVQYRQPYFADGSTLTMDGTMFQAALPAVFDGAEIHTTTGSPTYLLDVTPHPANTVDDTVLRPGQSMTDPHNGATVSVQAKTPDALTVTVTSPDIDFIPPPHPAIVNDGAGADIDTQADTTTLSANWAAVTDIGKGLDHYEYQIDTPDTTIVPPTDAGSGTSMTQTGLTLTAGKTYFVTVWAVDRGGNAGYPLASDGVTITGSIPPVSPSLTTGSAPAPPDCVYDGLELSMDHQATDATDVLSANWCPSPTPSKVNRYQYAIGTAPGATDVVDFTDVAKKTWTSRTGLSLTVGQRYYFTLRSVNASNVAGPTISSDGILVDQTAPPAIASVNDGLAEDIDVQASLETLSANWAPVSDPAGVYYQYAIGTTPGGQEYQSFSNYENSLLTAFALNLTIGSTYYLSVRPVDWAGNVGPITSSNGVTIDPSQDLSPPTVSVVDPLNGAMVRGVVTLTAEAADNLIVTSVQLRVDGVDFGSKMFTPPYSTAWSTSFLPDGNHVILAVASDGVHQTSSSEVTVNVHNTPGIDDEPPTVLIGSPLDNTTVSGTVNIFLLASDENDVTGVRILIDGLSVATLTSTSGLYQYALNTTLFANGTRILTAEATDTGNNTALSLPVHLIINNPLPPDHSAPGAVTDLRSNS